jgi:hypothetical protein
VGEWKIIFDNEIEGRWGTVKVYESEDDEDGDEGPVVRVTAAASSITLEPDPVEDLEEESIEIGFSPEATMWLVSKVPG